MTTKRNRLTYFILTITVMILGLSARRFSVYLPGWINAYLGDALWALMVFLGFGFLFRNTETKWVAIFAILFSFSIEVSQLYHAEWIDFLRGTRLGRLILGHGFLWRDLVSYTIGIGIGVFAERFILSNKQKF